MKKTIVVGLSLGLMGLAVSVGATGTPVTLSGADALDELARKVAASCGDDVAYEGSLQAPLNLGWNTGEAALAAGTQEIAPMTRGLGAGACAGETLDRARSELPAYSGVAISSNASDGCGATPSLASGGSFTVRDVNGNPVVGCPGCDPGTSTYTLRGPGGASDSANAWKDVLRLIFLCSAQPRVSKR